MIERFARVCYYLVTSLAVRFCALDGARAVWLQYKYYIRRCCVNRQSGMTLAQVLCILDYGQLHYICVINAVSLVLHLW